MAATLELIDADAHVNPPPTFWDEYLPSRLKGRGPQIEVGSNAEDHDWVVFEGSRKPLIVAQSVAGQGREHKMIGRFSEMNLGSWEAGARLADMATDGVPAAVLFGGGPLGSGDAELFTESFSAYNRWLADFCSADRQKLIGAAYLPMYEVDHAIGLLKEAAKLGMRAVNIPAFPMSKPGSGGLIGFAAQALALTGDPDSPRQYDSEEFDPFWKACVDLDMAVTIHLGARVARPNVKGGYTPVVMSKVTMAEPISIMIFGGVFDRFPALRFGSIESGVGWFAWMAEYMDNIWHGHPHWAHWELKNPPSYYMEQNVWGSFIRDSVGISQRHRKGAKNIMWSSDYPHSETSWPDSQASIERQFAGLTAEERRPVLYDNARRFYGL
jgi:predicted TIM-barrel fold metal-dependent hydrolase